MAEEPSTRFCGPPCEALKAYTTTGPGGMSKGKKWHQWIVLTIHGCEDGKPMGHAKAYQRLWPKAAVSTSQTKPGQMLKRPLVRAAYDYHAAGAEAEAVEWGDELRRMERQQARANLFDLIVAQEPTSEARLKLIQYCKKGIEVRDPATGEVDYRDPTEHEWRRAINDAASFRVKMADELTQEQQMQVEGVTYDSRGTIKYDTGRAAARARSAKLEGLLIEHQKIVVEAQSLVGDYWACLGDVLRGFTAAPGDLLPSGEIARGGEPIPSRLETLVEEARENPDLDTKAHAHEIARALKARIEARSEKP